MSVPHNMINYYFVTNEISEIEILQSNTRNNFAKYDSYKSFDIRTNYYDILLDQSLVLIENTMQIDQ